MAKKTKLCPELRTLCLKEELLAENLPITDELIESLKDAGIPVNVPRDQLLKGTYNKEKVKRLSSALQSSWNNEHFGKLCDILESINPWLADEFHFELQGENGTQVITEALDLENSRIVFKEFGHEKRLSELEKKKLHKLLNRKSQCTRDIWQKQLNRLNDRLEEATQKNNAIDEEALRLATDVEQFISKNASEHFQNRAIVSAARTTTDVFCNLPPLQQLEIQMNGLIQLSGQTIMETDNINDEKRRVAQKIELPLKPAERVENIDVKLNQHLQDKKEKIRECQKAIKDQQRLTEHLLEEIRRAERERQIALTKKQREIEELTEKVNAKDEENSDLLKCIENLQAELAVLHEQYVHFASRAKNLEHGKRLQTLFDTEIKEKDVKSGSAGRQLGRIEETRNSATRKKTK